MLVKDLAADRSWIELQRAAFKGTVSPERRESPQFQNALQHGTRLMNAALDHYEGISKGDSERVQKSLYVARLLAKDWTRPDMEGTTAEDRWWGLAQLSGLFSWLLIYVAARTFKDANLYCFVIGSLMVWGTFYGRIGIAPQESPQMPKAY